MMTWLAVTLVRAEPPQARYPLAGLAHTLPVPPISALCSWARSVAAAVAGAALGAQREGQKGRAASSFRPGCCTLTERLLQISAVSPCCAAVLRGPGWRAGRVRARRRGWGGGGEGGGRRRRAAAAAALLTQSHRNAPHRTAQRQPFPSTGYPLRWSATASLQGSEVRESRPTIAEQVQVPHSTVCDIARPVTWGGQAVY